MLFAQKLLAPGPQPKHPGNVHLEESEKEGPAGFPLSDAVAEGEFGKEFFLFGVFLPHEL
jgi:hypothetical protein